MFSDVKVFRKFHVSGFLTIFSHFERVVCEHHNVKSDPLDLAEKKTFFINTFFDLGQNTRVNRKNEEKASYVVSWN